MKTISKLGTDIQFNRFIEIKYMWMQNANKSMAVTSRIECRNFDDKSQMRRKVGIVFA